jgi:hypothetical protein
LRSATSELVMQQDGSLRGDAMNFEEIEERARELFSHANPDIGWYFLEEGDKNYWRKLAIEELKRTRQAEH